MKIKLGNKETIHFVGIGGIGMSGLAEVMKDMGFNVQGSDIANNKNIERCRKNGIKILLPTLIDSITFLGILEYLEAKLTIP